MWLNLEFTVEEKRNVTSAVCLKEHLGASTNETVVISDNKSTQRFVCVELRHERNLNKQQFLMLKAWE